MMKPKIRFKHWFVPPGKDAWVIAPYMFFRHAKVDVSDRLFRHELEHLYQVSRDGWFRFYLGYVWDWLTNGFDYHKIKYEVEARAKERQPLSPVERYWKDGNNPS